MGLQSALIGSAVAGKNHSMRSATIGLVGLLADTGSSGYSHCRKWVSQVAEQFVDSSSR
jgi:hypothetical protein